MRRKSVSSKCRNCGKVTFMGAYCAECRKLLIKKKMEINEALRESAKEGGYTLVKKDKGHGMECPCLECEKIRRLLRDSVANGKVHLVATEEDKKRLYK